MRRLHHTRRRALAGFAALALAAVLTALPASGATGTPASAESAAGPSPVVVKVGETRQSGVTAHRRLTAHVASSAPGRVRLFPQARGVETGRRAAKIGPARTVSLRRAGQRKVRLELNKRGRRLLAGCSGLRLIVKARFAPSERSTSRRGKAKGVRNLVLDGPGCSGGGPGGGGGEGPLGEEPNGNVIPPPQPWTGAPIPTANAERCDFVDPAVCLQPWPNDHFTIEDPTTDTGRRIDLATQSMPLSAPLGLGLPVKPIDPAEHNRNDGFSPGNLIVTKVPGLETQEALESTGAVTIDRPELYDDPEQPVVVINADTGERHPVWAEIDSNPADPADVNLIIRPLVNFDEGGRYVVGLRNLRDAEDEPIEPADAFRVYRDNLTTTQDPVEARRRHMEELFAILGRAQIQRSGLYLAWDFTVASERNLTERMLTIRDAAFAQLGDEDLADGEVEGSSPGFSMSFADIDPEADQRIAREVSGTVTVPCFMTLSCANIGATFNNGTRPDGLPSQSGTTEVEFVCRIPRESLGGPMATNTRPSLYGHGLLGSMSEVGGGNVSAMAFESGMTFCATDWYGFSTPNIVNVLVILQDLSRFRMVADGTQQGFLNFLLLGRAMIHPAGFSAHPAFQAPDGDDPGTEPDPVLDTTQLFYDGNSQGGIFGGGLTAFAPDFERAVLGVPGMNYSTLLRRSVDFELYSEGRFGEVLEEAICDQAGAIPVPELATLVISICAGVIPDDTSLGLYDNYPNELERPLVLSLMQMLWDRGEANGVAHHMTSDPLENTPPHEVLLQAAFGDHQVANVAAEVEARTIGASVYQPALDPGRHWEADGSDQIFGIPAIGAFPFAGSALVYWDGGPIGFAGGTATPPNGNLPPRSSDGYGADPHSYPRNDVKARAQKGAFLTIDGPVRNPCTTTNNLASPVAPIAFENGTPIPCYAHGWTGP